MLGSPMKLNPSDFSHWTLVFYEYQVSENLFVNVVQITKQFVACSVVINNSTFFFAVIYASTSYIAH